MISNDGNTLTVYFLNDEADTIIRIVREVTRSTKALGHDVPGKKLLDLVEEKGRAEESCAVILSMSSFRVFCLHLIETITNLVEERGGDASQMHWLLRELTGGQYQPDVAN